MSTGNSVKNIDLNLLRLFQIAVEAGNFSKASEQLGVPRSYFSRHIKTLEESLGFQLVSRNPRKFELTTNGSQIYEVSRQSILNVESVIEKLNSHLAELSGIIRFTCPEDFGTSLMGSLIHDFLVEHPKIQIEALLTNTVLDLAKERIDIALRAGPLKDSRHKFKLIKESHFILLASPSYVDRFQQKIQIKNLNDLPTLAFAPVSAGHIWHLTDQNQKLKININPVFLANNLLVIKELTLKGTGLALLPKYLCGAEIARGELIHVLPQWFIKSGSIHLLFPNAKDQSTRVKVFSDYLKKHLIRLI